MRHVLMLITALAADAATPQSPSRPRAYGPGVCGPIDASYVRTATASGGQPFPLSPSETAKMGLFLAESSRSDAALLLWAGGGADAARDGYELPVDGSVGRLTFSVTFDGSGGTVDILGPDGRVFVGGPGVEDIVLSCGRVVSIDRPAVGTWRVTPSPASRFWLVARGRSARDLLAVQFVRQGGRPGHEGLFPVDGSPIAGRPALLRVRVADFDDAQPSFVLLSSEGRPVQRLALDRIDDEEFVGTLDLPAVPFRVAVSGRDAAGATYQRADTRLFRAEVLEVLPEGDDTVAAGRDAAVAFTIRSHGARGPYRITATIGAEIVRRVEPPVVDFATRAEQRIVVWIPAATLASSGPSLELLVVAATVDPSEPSSNSAFRRLTVEPR